MPARGMAMARVSLFGSAVPSLLVALLVCAASQSAVTAGGTACDGVSCGMGACKEITLPIPQSLAYECDCYAGWARISPIVPSLPCLIPTCPSDLSCYTPTFKLPPLGSNVTLHPCLVMDCGPEGTCVEEQDKPASRCQCNSGATNVLNNPSLPCTKNCVIGKDGCPVKNPPPPPSLPAPPPQLPQPSSAAPPPDNGHGSSGQTAPPSSTEGNPTTSTSPGSVCFPNLLLTVMLVVSLTTRYII